MVSLYCMITLWLIDLSRDIVSCIEMSRPGFLLEKVSRGGGGTFQK